MDPGTCVIRLILPQLSPGVAAVLSRRHCRNFFVVGFLRTVNRRDSVKARFYCRVQMKSRERQSRGLYIKMIIFKIANYTTIGLLISTQPSL